MIVHFRNESEAFRHLDGCEVTVVHKSERVNERGIVRYSAAGLIEIARDGMRYCVRLDDVAHIVVIS